MTNRGTGLLAVGFGVAVAGALLTRGGHSERSLQAVLSDLARVSDSRIVEPRLSLPLPYAPFHAISAEARRESLLHHEAQLFGETGSLALVQEPALTNLLLGEWEKALHEMERPKSKTSPVDLAAAYYMRGVTTDALLDFCRALDVLRDAPDSPEVLFNRALILEQLSDFEAASVAWGQYLAKDASSPWASEARMHLARASQPPVASTWLRDKAALFEAAAFAMGKWSRPASRRVRPTRSCLAI